MVDTVIDEPFVTYHCMVDTLRDYRPPGCPLGGWSRDGLLPLYKRGPYSGEAVLNRLRAVLYSYRITLITFGFQYSLLVLYLIIDDNDRVRRYTFSYAIKSTSFTALILLCLSCESFDNLVGYIGAVTT